MLSSNGSLSRIVAHMSLRCLLLAIGAHACVPSPDGDRVTKPVRGFSRFHLVSFALADPIGYPFAIINSSCEASSKASNVCVVFEIPEHMFTGRPITTKEEREKL